MTAAPLTIRIVAPSDAVALAALARTCYREHFAGIWSPAGLEGYLDASFQVDDLEAELRTGQTTYLVAEREGRFEGYARLCWAPSGEAELGRLYVRAASVRCGIGAQLLARALTRARAVGCTHVTLRVLKSNVRGRAFYEASGFFVVGEEPCATDRGQIGYWVLRLALTGEVQTGCKQGCSASSGHRRGVRGGGANSS